MQEVALKRWRHAFEEAGHRLGKIWDRTLEKGRSLWNGIVGKEKSDTVRGEHWNSDRALELRTWFHGPKVEVSESRSEVRVRAALPGLDKDSFEIDVAGRLLTLRAEKRHESERQVRGYYFRSRSYGSYLRTIPLPSEVDTEHATAKYRGGVLTITLPKARTAATQRIEING